MLTSIFSPKRKEIQRLNDLNEKISRDIAEKDLLVTRLQQDNEALLGIKSAMEGSSAAIMTINRDFIVTL